MKRKLLALSLVSMSITLVACDRATTEMNTESYTQLTKHLGHELPKEYIDFLAGENGDEVEDNFFWVIQDDWGSGVDRYYPLENSVGEITLLSALKEEYPPIKEGMLPIADDNSFGYVLMSFQDGEVGSIYFMAQWKDDGTELIDGWGYWKIADSFSSFQKSLMEPPEDEL